MMIKNLIIPTKENNYKPLFSTRVAMVIFTLWILLSNSFASVLFDNFGVYATNMTASRIIELTNQERASRGLGTLKSNAYLTSAAYAKANNMFELQYWDHFGPNGESPWQFIKAAGYDYMYAGENLAKGFTTSEGVHQAWMASPTHRDNIISPHYEEIGVALVNGVLHGENIVLVVQMFGSSPKSIPVEPAPVVETEQAPQPAPAPKEVRYIQGDSEDGKTKSIRIIYPEQDSMYNDPQIPVKGETTNFSVGSVVEIVMDNSTIGQTTVEQGNAWVFQNSFDWKEGRNSIDAVIGDNDNKQRDSVSFIISSVPPAILGINVKKEGETFVVAITVEERATEVALVIGGDIVQGELSEGLVSFAVHENDVKGKVFIVVSDIHGNINEEDISKLFVDEVEKGKFPIGGFVNFSIASIQRTITVLLATIIFAVLLMQMYFYKQADRLREQGGDFLMIGLWWFVLLFGSFIGYSGSIY